LEGSGAILGPTEYACQEIIVFLKGFIMNESVTDYVGQRAKLLASLVLTRRKDIRLITLDAPQDSGIDLLAQMTTPVMNGQVLPSFGIEVKGTGEPLIDEHSATKFANHSRKHWPFQGLFFLPIVVFLFSMEEDQGYFSWLMQPHVSKEDGPTLFRVASLEMKKITKKSVDSMIHQVEQWSEAMGEVSMKFAPAK
jgi:hypothetical protein